MFRILDQQQLDASIKSFMERKCDKFDIPVTPSRSRNGIRSRLAESRQLMKDCVSGGYIWRKDSFIAG